MARWLKDVIREDWLKGLGAEIEYRGNTLLSQFVPDWKTRENKGRPEMKMDDVVLSYALAQEEGIALPPCILHKTPTGLEILDGKLRSLAVDLNSGTSVAAYIILTDDPRTLELIERTANAHNGEKPARNWRIQQAISLIQRQGYSLKEVALSCQVSEDAISSAMKSKEVATMLERRGVEVAPRTNGLLSDLYPVMEADEDVCTDAYRFAVDTGMNKDERDSCIGGVLKQNSKTAMVQELTRRKDDPNMVKRANGSHPRKLTPSKNLFQRIASLETVIKSNHNGFDFTEEEKKKLDKFRKWFDGRVNQLLQV